LRERGQRGDEYPILKALSDPTLLLYSTGVDDRRDDADASLYRCYFESWAGEILISPERFSDPQEAALYGSLVLTYPYDFILIDLDDEEVSASLVNADMGVTVEG
jgi:hypothetical protein